MTTRDAIRFSLNMSRGIIDDYTRDLDDADLLVRPVSGMNHIAWQLGHLVESERSMVAELGRSMPELPAGFEQAHTRETAGLDDRRRFATRAVYMQLMDKVRAGTLAALDATPEADFDKPGPESMRAYAPTVGAVFMTVANHALMHCGQFVAVRRLRGKPIAI